MELPSKDEFLRLLESGILTEEEELELKQLLEEEIREQAFQDYSIFAEEYIKITNKKGKSTKEKTTKEKSLCFPL